MENLPYIMYLPDKNGKNCESQFYFDVAIDTIKSEISLNNFRCFPNAQQRDILKSTGFTWDGVRRSWVTREPVADTSATMWDIVKQFDQLYITNGFTFASDKAKSYQPTLGTIAYTPADVQKGCTRGKNIYYKYAKASNCIGETLDALRIGRISNYLSSLSAEQISGNMAKFADTAMRGDLGNTDRAYSDGFRCCPQASKYKDHDDYISFCYSHTLSQDQTELLALALPKVRKVLETLLSFDDKRYNTHMVKNEIGYIDVEKYRNILNWLSKNLETLAKTSPALMYDAAIEILSTWADPDDFAKNTNHLFTVRLIALYQQYGDNTPDDSKTANSQKSEPTEDKNSQKSEPTTPPSGVGANEIKKTIKYTDGTQKTYLHRLFSIGVIDIPQNYIKSKDCQIKLIINHINQGKSIKFDLMERYNGKITAKRNITRQIKADWDKNGNLIDYIALTDKASRFLRNCHIYAPKHTAEAEIIDPLNAWDDKVEQPSEQPKEEKTEPITVDAAPIYHEINEQLARQAKEFNSFSEYEKGSQTAGYKSQVDEVFKLVNNSPDPERSLYYAKTFSKRYAQLINDRNRNEASCPSILITGGGNFPVRKKERQNERRQSLWEKEKEILGLKELVKNPPQSREKVRETLTADEFEDVQYFKVVANKEVNRLQLVNFEEMPSDEQKTILKSHGFKWSPRFKAWQRQLTENAIAGTWRVIKEFAKLEENALNEYETEITSQRSKTAPKLETAPTVGKAKVDKSALMRRAWQIYRTLEGDHRAKMSMAMRLAWAEIKGQEQATTIEVTEIKPNRTKSTPTKPRKEKIRKNSRPKNEELAS